MTDAGQAVPVFVNCRDRVESLRRLVDWLERAGTREIYLLDNDSAYEPLLAYYRETPHTVVRLGRNYGKFALWEAPGTFALTAGRPFVYTDPDVVPCEECPPDAVERLRALLERYPGVNKAGLGLRLDDLPAHYPHRQAVLEWEQVYWDWKVERGVYYAPIDTTFAVYRADGQPKPLTALRTGHPYVARHEPWYADPAVERPEEAFYEARALEMRRSSWSAEVLPPEFADSVEARRRERRLTPERVATRLRWRLRGARNLRRPPQGH